MDSARESGLLALMGETDAARERDVPAGRTHERKRKVKQPSGSRAAVCAWTSVEMTPLRML